MSRQARSFCIVGAIVAIVFALAAPSFACDGCVQEEQVVYAAPLVQRQVLVPQYVQPLQVQSFRVQQYTNQLRHQIQQLQSYQQPVVAQQVLFNKARFVPQRSVQIQRVRQPRVQRQVIRTRNVQAIQAY